MSEQEIKITAQLFPDPDVCIFRVDRPVFPGGAYDCKSAEMAKDSPLLEALFALKGVREIFITGDSLTISKDSDEDWQVLGREVGKTIRQAINSGKPLMAENLKQPMPPDDEIKKIVTEMLEEQINPAIASHGGFVNVVDVKEGRIFMQMSGGCQGCASSSMTLRYGIERMIRERIPQIIEIVDVTDHGAGVNPYY